MRLMVALMLAIPLLARGQGAADEKQQGTASPGKTESLTVIQPGPGGDVRIMSKDSTTADVAKLAKPAQAVAEDRTPRKARVVVVPAIFAKGVRAAFESTMNETWGVGDHDVVENPGYTSYLVDALVNSHKFDVLEREVLGAVTRELDFGVSDYANPAKVAHLGEMLNADYVVIPEIRYMGLLMSLKNIPYVGQQQREFRGKLATNVRTVDVRTSRIVASRIKEVETRARLRRAAGSPASPVRDFVDSLYAESARNEAAAIMDVAYPIKVVVITGQTCVLNRGEGAVREGELFNIYRPGEAMVDPDTKETLGYQESRVGRVKVLKVDEKTCTAEIVEGAGKIEKLFLGRRDVVAEPEAEPEAAPKLD